MPAITLIVALIAAVVYIFLPRGEGARANLVEICRWTFIVSLAAFWFVGK